MALATLVGVLVVALPLYLIFGMGLIGWPPYVKAMALILGFPLFLLARAVFIEKMTTLTAN